MEINQQNKKELEDKINSLHHDFIKQCGIVQGICKALELTPSHLIHREVLLAEMEVQNKVADDIFDKLAKAREELSKYYEIKNR